MTDGPSLREPGRSLVALSAALATRDADTVESALRLAAARAQPDQVEEVLLQSHLFVGFPDALEAMLRWRELSGPAPPRDPEPEDAWRERGERICATVYGRSYARLRDNVAALHPDLDRWMVVGGYGRVLGRPGLDLATRELCTVALLAVWDAPRQLHSHLRGALNAGAAPRAVQDALELARAHLHPDAVARVWSLWERVRDGNNLEGAGNRDRGTEGIGPDSSAAQRGDPLP